MKKLIIILISVFSLGMPYAHAMQQQQQIQRPQQKVKQKPAEHAHDECACEHHHEVPQESAASHEQAPQKETTIPQETVKNSDAETKEHICTFGGHEPCSACNCEKTVCKAPRCAAKIHTFKCIECGKTMELASQAQTTMTQIIASFAIGAAYGALTAAYPYFMIPFTIGMLATGGGCPG